MWHSESPPCQPFHPQLLTLARSGVNSVKCDRHNKPIKRWNQIAIRITIICIIFVFKFLGCKRRDGDLFYLVKFVDQNNPEEIPARLAKENWPKMLLRFYQNRLRWVGFGGNTHNAIPTAESTTMNEDEKPESVLCKFGFVSFFSFVRAAYCDAVRISNECFSRSQWLQL